LSLRRPYAFHFQDESIQNHVFPNGTSIGEIKPILCPTMSPKFVHVSVDDHELDDFTRVDSAKAPFFSVTVDSFESFPVENPFSQLKSISLPHSAMTVGSLRDTLELDPSSKLTLLGRVLDYDVPLKWARHAPIKVQRDASVTIVTKLPDWKRELGKCDDRPKTIEFVCPEQRFRVKFASGATVRDAEVFFADYLRISFPPHVLVCQDHRLLPELRLCPFSGIQIEIRLQLASAAIRVKLPDATEFITELPPEATVADLSAVVEQKVKVGRFVVHGKVLFKEQVLNDVYQRPSVIVAMPFEETIPEPQTSQSAVRVIRVEFFSEGNVLPLSIPANSHFGDVLPTIGKLLSCPPERIVILIEQNGRESAPSNDEFVAIYAPCAKLKVVCKEPSQARRSPLTDSG
jgi:hypothetical protein